MLSLQHPTGFIQLTSITALSHNYVRDIIVFWAPHEIYGGATATFGSARVYRADRP